MNKRIVGLAALFLILSLLIAPAPVAQAATAPVAVESAQPVQPEQVMRFLRINVYVYACDSVWSGFPPMLNPVNCSPLNQAYWQFNYNGSNFMAGPTTNANGYAYIDFPVQSNIGGTIICRGYSMDHVVSYGASQPSITCRLYSVRS